MLPAPADEELCRRLPLPLAQLYRHAHNAYGPADRHLHAFYLWEAALRLAASAAVVDYLATSRTDPETAGGLENLARPSLGHWWQLLRSLLPPLAGSAEPGYPKLHDFLAGGPAVDLPRAARLHAALRVVLEDNPDEEKRQAALRQRVADGGGGAVKPAELFDRLVEYRNKVIGHQNFLGRPPWFHELMAPVMLAGVAEVLARWDVLAGRRLVYVDKVDKRRSGDFEVQRYALEGGSARLLVPPLQVAEAEAGGLRPQCVYLEAEPPDAAGGPGRLLHPLLLYEKETEAVFFLRSRAKKAGLLEYDNLLRGVAVRRADLGPEPRPLLARVLGLAGGPTPPLVHPSPAPPARPRRRRLALAAAGGLAVGCLLAVSFWPRDCTLERGEALLSQGRYKEAIQCFEAIIAREPSTSQRAFRDRADACRKNGDDKPQRALQLYDEALKLENGKVPDYQQAVEKYRQAIQLDPPFFWAANNLAYLRAVCPEEKLQNPDEAVRLAEDACRRSGGKCWEVLDTLAVALAVRGDFDAALERTLQALQRAPETEKALLNAKLESYRKRQPWKPNPTAK